MGVTWNYPASGGPAVIGNLDAFAWLDADGTYGTTQNRVFLACYNQTDSTLYSLASDDFGNNWDDTLDLKAISTLPYDPYYPVDPDIEAAVAYDHVMLVCTHDHDFDGQDDDDVGQTYSTDAGETWPNPLWNLNGATDDHEFGADLNANEGGGSWHLTYTRWETPVNDHFVQYSQRQQDLGDYWQSFPDVVDDLALASIGYSKKGIASNWSTDVAGICWADYRDGTPDYDLYFDYDRGGASGPTVACSYSCSPSSGQLPFSTQMTVNMTNLYTGFTRTISGRINISTAGGGYISNWRAGFTNIPAGGTFTRSWNQNLPALGALYGTNYFYIYAMDTTASPYNQPPYPASGDTDIATCLIVGN